MGLNFLFLLLTRSEGEEGRGEQWVEIVSWEPRAFIYHNFLVSLRKEFAVLSIVLSHSSFASVLLSFG